MDGIIFDIDGTLWDIAQICAEAWNDAIADYSDSDVRVSADQLKLLFGKPTNVIFESVFPDMSEEERQILSEHCCEYEHDYIAKAENPPVYEGVEDTIRRLSKDYPLFIVSNCQKGYIELFLEKTGMSMYFSDFLCCGDTRLPKGQNIKLLIQKNHLWEAVYVGDTRGDEEACMEAGVPFIFASYGFGKAEKPYQVIRSFPELLNRFTGSI